MRVSTEFQVRLAHLDYNFGQLKKLAPSNDVIFMVKGNAYGHGILEISSFAVEVLGIERLGCASLGEALYIRKELPKLECELWVFSDLNLTSKISISAYTENKIYPVISSLKHLDFFLETKEFENIPLILKIDTGMHRLGIMPKEIELMIQKLKSSGRMIIHHLMTHFSNSYFKIKPNDKTQRQYESFLQIKAEIKTNGFSINETSVSNSGAIEQSFGLEESHIRPGLMLYGPCSFVDPQKKWDGKNLSQFKTEIIKLREIKRGHPIGYGSHVCGKNGFVVYLPVGYADGILTYYSGKKFECNGVETQILGRVNMDITFLFYESLSDELKEGKDFYFWGYDTDLSEMAFKLQTNPYQLLTGITSRVPRKYLS